MKILGRTHANNDRARGAEPPHRIVARYRDGRLIKGYSLDFTPGAPVLQLVPDPARPQKGVVSVAINELKAAFFVRDFDGNPGYAEQKEFPDVGVLKGRKAEVVFADGEVLTGYTVGYDPDRPGFFLFPADPNSNNLRIFVVNAAVSEVRGPSGRWDSFTETNGGAMGSHNTTQGRTLLRHFTEQWQGIVGTMQELVRENEELGTRLAEREREQDERLERRVLELREESDAVAEKLSTLEDAHRRLTEEHEETTRALRELSAQHEALLRERQWLANEFDELLGHLKRLGARHGLTGADQDLSAPLAAH